MEDQLGKNDIKLLHIFTLIYLISSQSHLLSSLTNNKFLVLAAA